MSEQNMIMANYEEVTILLVEDDPGHARLIEKNLRRAKVGNKIITFDDGQMVLDYLFSRGKYLGNDPAQALLMLLDLNLPVLDGYQVLKQIKMDDTTSRIPVIVLTTTDNQYEVFQCYQLGCNIYITKPVEYQRFSEAIQKLGLFLTVVKIPNGV